MEEKQECRFLGSRIINHKKPSGPFKIPVVHLKWLWGKWIDCDEADVCYHQGGMEWQRQRCPIQSKCHKFPLLRFGNLSGGKSILGQDSNVDNRFFIIIQQPCVGIYFYVKETHWSYEIKKWKFELYIIIIKIWLICLIPHFIISQWSIWHDRLMTFYIFWQTCICAQLLILWWVGGTIYNCFQAEHVAFIFMSLLSLTMT